MRIILLLLLISTGLQAQVLQETNGRRADRINVFKDGFRLPQRCNPSGPPELLNYSTYDGKGAEVYDTCNNNIKVWNGTTWDSLAIGSGGGSGSTEYVVSGLGIRVDSAGRVYTVNVDTASSVILSRQRAANTYSPLQSAGLSVWGRSANSTGDMAPITASTNHDVLRLNGTTLAFGKLNVLGIDATGTPSSTTLLYGNGTWGTNTALDSAYIKIASTGAVYSANGGKGGTTANNNNFAIGLSTLNGITNGVRNLALGNGALKSANYSDNTAVGNSSMENATGSGNTAMGTFSLRATTGANNTGIGANALALNSSGLENTAIGNNAGPATTTGGKNFFGGFNARAAAASSNVVVIGGDAGNNNLPSNSVAVGFESLFTQSTGNPSVGIGQRVFKFGTGQGNTGVGQYIGSTSGTFVGGDYNSALGYTAANAITSGDYNTLAGALAGASGTGNLTTGSNSVGLGAYVKFPSSTDNNQFVVSVGGTSSYNIVTYFGSGNFLLNTTTTQVNTPTASTALEINGVLGAVLLPRLSTTERNALTATNGHIIYNTTDSKFQGYAGGAWVDLH